MFLYLMSSEMKKALFSFVNIKVMQHYATLLFFTFSVMSCGTNAQVPTPKVAAAKPEVPQDRSWSFETTPIWTDEFNYTGKPDPAKWGYDTGGNGWGNNELQYYTDSSRNSYVSDGTLKVTARKENHEGNEYTSARLVSKDKGDFLYGRFEIKAKLPTGRGTWPAIWMLPTDWAYGGWPKSGEIDIMEHVGFDQNNVHITVHTEAYNHSKETQKGKSKVIETASTAFHLYRVDWTPFAVRGYIDDQPVFEFTNEGKGSSVWPFDKRFHLLMNIAVGGNWGGAAGVDPAVFPQSMEVDYVRVYEMIAK